MIQAGANPAEVVLQARELRKSFGSKRNPRQALDGLSIEVREGEIFGIVGCNGSGKTTFADIVSGVTLPDSGSASVCRRDVVRQAPEVRILLARTFIIPTLDREITVRQNVSWRARLYPGRPNQAIERCMNMLRGFGFEDSLLDVRVRTLSPGKRQVVAICCALLGSPRVLILDEPTTALDAVVHEEARRVIQAIQKAGVTVLLVTNDLGDAEKLCQRLAVIRKGRIVASGTKEELLALCPGAQNLRQVFFRLAGYTRDTAARPPTKLTGVA